MSRLKAVSIIGPSEASSARLCEAEEVGRGVAQRGWVLMSGGHGGVMEAACRGADSENGLTVGVIRTAHPDDANPHVRVAIATGLGESRNFSVVSSGDAVVVVGFSQGTLSEIAFAAQQGRPLLAIRPEVEVPGVTWTSCPDVAAVLEALERILTRTAPLLARTDR